MRKRTALLAGVLSGLASSGTVAQPARYPSLEGSDLNRLRGDVSRVGLDFSNVIARENGQVNETAGTKPRRYSRQAG